MTTVTVNIPDKEKRRLSSFVKEHGGEIVDTSPNGSVADSFENGEDDEVTHGEFFGENIKRAIRLLKKR